MGRRRWGGRDRGTPGATRIDNAAFQKADLVTVPNSTTLLSATTDARYAFALRFGPRDYHNWFKQLRTLDASSIQVRTAVAERPDHRLVQFPGGQPAHGQHCGGARRLRRGGGEAEFTDIPVTCSGPATQAQGLKNSPQITVEWNAQMTLIGGREQRTRQFSGSQSVLMSFATQPGGARTLDFRTP